MGLLGDAKMTGTIFNFFSEEINDPFKGFWRTKEVKEVIRIMKI